MEPASAGDTDLPSAEADSGEKESGGRGPEGLHYPGTPTVEPPQDILLWLKLGCSVASVLRAQEAHKDLVGEQAAARGQPQVICLPHEQTILY
jgi:hypothetical protein